LAIADAISGSDCASVGDIRDAFMRDLHFDTQAGEAGEAGFTCIVRVFCV